MKRYLLLSLPLSLLPCPSAAQSGVESWHAANDANLLLAQAAPRARQAQQTGHIEIITDPPGFEIVVNGTKRAERTNATLELPQGRYQVELVWPSSSYRHSFDFELLPGDVLTQRFAMRGSVPLGAPPAQQATQRQRGAVRTGYLEIITEPPGLEIFVDGAKRKERTNANLELVEGRHRIELVVPATAYRHAFDVQMMPADILQQRVDMRGSLRVDSFWLQDGKKSAGPELELLLDGKPISQGRPIEKLLAGTHELRVRYHNFEKTQRVEIRPGSSLQINYSIERGSDPGRVPF